MTQEAGIMMLCEQLRLVAMLLHYAQLAQEAVTQDKSFTDHFESLW